MQARISPETCLSRSGEPKLSVKHLSTFHQPPQSFSQALTRLSEVVCLQI